MSIKRSISLSAVLVAALFSSSAVMAAGYSNSDPCPGSCSVPAGVANSDRLFFLGGTERTADLPGSKNSSTYTYGAEFLHQIAPHYSLGLDYINQGHFDGGVSHHRDLDGVNFWVHTDPQFAAGKLNLAFGLGPVFFYDTVGNVDGHPADQHGLGMSYSLAATWQENSWLYRVRLSHVDAGSFKTNALLLGVGFQFGSGSMGSTGSGHGGAGHDTMPDDYSGRPKEVTIYSGLTVVNQPGNASSRAFALEYRRDLNSYLQYTLTAQSEGGNAMIDRKGVAGEIWLAKSFLDDRLSLGAGIGLLAAHDGMRPSDKNFVTPMRSISAAYRINPDWSVRVKFDRVISNYNRDTDIFMLGVGRRF